MAQHKIPLSQADKWLNHLSSCSPCFQDFRRFRTETSGNRRVLQMALAAAAVILIVIGGLLWVRSRSSSVQTATVTIDLRERSIARGENPAEIGQRPLGLSPRARHLVLDLPVGSKEGSYELALFRASGEAVTSTTGIAQLENHVVILRADVDLSGVSPGAYVFGIRQPGLEWTRYPVRVK